MSRVKPTARQKKSLWEAVTWFIDNNAIYCEEKVFQSDRIAEESLPFIHHVCNIVGYAEVEVDE